MRITDASRSVLPDKHLRVNAPKSLQIPVGLAPSVFVDNIGQRNAVDWTPIVKESQMIRENLSGFCLPAY